MQKRNGEKKISRIVFMSLGEKVSNFITHLHNSAILGDSIYAVKKKVGGQRKFVAKKWIRKGFMVVGVSFENMNCL